MTIAIVVLMLLGYVLICVEHVTHLNKATVAMFCGVVGWVLFMCMGTSFIQVLHAQEFLDYLAGEPYTLEASKQFIASHIFLQYFGQMGGIVLYVLATMAIVEVLVNNECFNFLKSWLRSQNTNHVLWLTVLVTFAISAHIDNLSATVMMLLVMRRILRVPHQRMYIGAAIVITANAAGMFTVIGDISSLLIWTKGAVTATNYTGSLALSAVVATVIPTFFIRRALPDRLDIERPTYSFRGEDSALKIWQRAILVFLAFAGLWFVPTFHRITLLPPFLGALCVLGVIWVAAEVINISRIRTEQPQTVSTGRSLQYEVIQVIMYTIGACLCVDVLIEIGAMRAVSGWLDANIHSTYLLSVVLGLLSAVMDNIVLVLSAVNIYPVLSSEEAVTPYLQNFMQNGQYWHLVALSGNIGGCLLPIGSIAGLALMKSEDVTIWWWFRRITLGAFIGWACALGTYFLVDYFLR